MPRKTEAEFKIDYVQILNEKGTVDKKLLPKIPKAKLLKMYTSMVYARLFDTKMLALQRQGRLGTLAQGRGQEASQVGAIANLTEDDWNVPAFREISAYAYRGCPLRKILMYYAGDERGSFIEGKHNDTPIAIPVGSQIPHAVGIAWGMKYRKEKKAAMVFFSDGATSEGDFHEGLNFAGVMKAPCVFICQNNQYAISTPKELQTASQTYAQKALAYGVEGIKVDGNDIFAVYAAAEYAVNKAKAGKGPTLIECFTYRLADHTTSDDAKKYRTEKEVKEWEKKDPIIRFKKYLIDSKLWTEAEDKKHIDDSKKQVEIEVKAAENAGKPEIQDMFRFMYAELTPALKEQLEYAKQFEGETKEQEENIESLKDDAVEKKTNKINSPTAEKTKVRVSTQKGKKVEPVKKK